MWLYRIYTQDRHRNNYKGKSIIQNSSKPTSLSTVVIFWQHIFSRISVVVVRLQLEWESLALYGERRFVMTAITMATTLSHCVCCCTRRLHLTTEWTHYWDNKINRVLQQLSERCFCLSTFEIATIFTSELKSITEQKRQVLSSMSLRFTNMGHVQCIQYTHLYSSNDSKQQNKNS